jgi:anaerobic ribonucleoside-triphosphate reductase activating protein
VKVRIYQFLPATDVEGPGRRACLWVQGCSIQCPGCFNHHIWTTEGGKVADVDELAERIIRTPEIEGVTFLGGEPFDQSAALAALGKVVREAGLSVMTFSGYEYETLVTSSRSGWRDLLAVTDLLVDGPYVKSLPDHRRPWVGSTNQRFHFLTPRYRHLARMLDQTPDRIEIRLRHDGTVWINGMCSSRTLGGLRQAVAGRRQRM